MLPILTRLVSAFPVSQSSSGGRMHSGPTTQPQIIYGTAWKKEATRELVLNALRLGFRAVDTACQPKHYNEELVGEGIADAEAEGIVSRSDLYLQTKFTPLAGQDPDRVPYDSGAMLEEQVKQSVQASLRNLRTTYVDCLLLHSPLPTHGDTMRVWRSMEQHVASGEVKSREFLTPRAFVHALTGALQCAHADPIC